MTIAVISASMRKESQSLKVSEWLKNHAEKELGCTVELLDLHALDLPMFTDSTVNNESVNTVLTTLEVADAAVFVSPEWNGMMSHGLVNMQHYLKNELANKPVMLTGVSSGRGGNYPVMQMRTMGYKNKHYVISSENLVVQGVKDTFNTHELDESSKDFSLKKRADYSLKVLIEYAKALHDVRQSGVIDLDSFASGM